VTTYKKTLGIERVGGRRIFLVLAAGTVCGLIGTAPLSAQSMLRSRITADQCSCCRPMRR